MKIDLNSHETWPKKKTHAWFFYKKKWRFGMITSCIGSKYDMVFNWFVNNGYWVGVDEVSEWHPCDPDGWIRVEDGLPEKLEEAVLVVDNVGYKSVASYLWSGWVADRMVENITHWQPLPARPKEE